MNAIAMAITVVVFALFTSVVLELRHFNVDTPKGGLTRMIVVPKLILPGTTYDGMPMSLYSTLTSIDGVKAVVRRLVINGRHPSGATYSVFGEEDAGIDLNPDVYPLPPDAIATWSKDPLGAIVTVATARDLNLQLGQTAEVPTSFGPLKIKVVALMSGGLFTQQIAVHFGYLQEFAKMTETCGFRVYTDAKDAGRVSLEIAERTKNSAMPVQAFNTAQVRAVAARQSAAIPAVLGFLGIFLVFTTGLTLANNSAISIRERRTEAATLRVLGYYRSTIFGLFISEAVLVGLIGGLVALAITYFGFHSGVNIGAAGLGRSYGMFQAVKLGWVSLAGGVILSILVPLAGALPAAIVAVRMPLLEGLRDTA